MAEVVHERVWHSACESGECVEVCFDGESVLVRESRNPAGPTLTFTHAEWRAFCDAIRNGSMVL